MGETRKKEKREKEKRKKKKREKEFVLSRKKTRAFVALKCEYDGGGQKGRKLGKERKKERGKGTLLGRDRKNGALVALK